ncbi:DUF5990 family protein [uncultured Rhodococcus sp.]|uniref:DUF5990 family protein n=1 Tax=uncultured Rhodococcus sp. TaxID=194249 RepID=UPI0028DBDDC4|nr:DUF5990 family protein [uncultured Rhodococcus sp.]
MQIIIIGHSLPGRECSETATFEGRSNIHVGVQRRGKPHEILDLVPGDTETVRWELTASLERKSGAWDILGPYIQGPPRGRFIYLSWVTVSDDQTFEMFRRAKLMLDAIPEHIVEQADASGMLHGDLGLTDAAGKPLCAAIRPPTITWSPSPY